MAGELHEVVEALRVIRRGAYGALVNGADPHYALLDAYRMLEKIIVDHEARRAAEARELEEWLAPTNECAARGCPQLATLSDGAGWWCEAHVYPESRP